MTQQSKQRGQSLPLLHIHVLLLHTPALCGAPLRLSIIALVYVSTNYHLIIFMSRVSRTPVLRGSKKKWKGKKEKTVWRKRGWQTIHTYGSRGCNSQQAFILVRGANGRVLERLRSPFHTSFFSVCVCVWIFVYYCCVLWVIHVD